MQATLGQMEDTGKWRTCASSFFCWVCWWSSAFVPGGWSRGRRRRIAGSRPRDHRRRIAGKVFDCEQRLVLGSILGRSLAKLLVPCFAEVRVSVSCRICIDLFASAAGMMRAIRKFLFAQWDATTKDFAAELLFDSKEVVAE